MSLAQRTVTVWTLAFSLAGLAGLWSPSVHAISTALSSDTTVVFGDTWTVHAGDELSVPAGVNLTIEGVMQVHGGLLVEGTLHVYGRLSVEGTLECGSLYVASSGSVEIHGIARHFGRVRNFGIFESFDGIVSTTSDFENSGYLFNNGDMLNTGEFQNRTSGYMINQRYFITDGEFDNEGEVLNRYTPGSAGSETTRFENLGEIHNASDAEFRNVEGIVDNSRSFENDGYYFNTVGGEFINHASGSFVNNPFAMLINGSGTFDNKGIVTNSAALIENGEEGLIINRWTGSSLHGGPFTRFSLNGPGDFVNRGGIQNESLIANHGTFRNGDGVIYNFCDASLSNFADFFNTGGLVRNWGGTVHANHWVGPAAIDMGICWRP